LPDAGYTAASIDIGSNTIRVLTVRFEDPQRPGSHGLRPQSVGTGRIVRLHDTGAFARLGRGVALTGRMTEENMAGAVELIASYTREARAHGAEDVFAFATAAVRLAQNGREFLDRVADSAGIRPRLIDGDEEAEWSFLGATFGEDDTGMVAVIDVGGGSTEIAVGAGRQCSHKTSCAIGSGSLREAAPTGERAVSEAEFDRMVEVARERLSPASGVLDRAMGADVIGIGGTVTGLAACDLGLRAYDPSVIHRHPLSLERLRRLAAELSALPLPERRQFPGLAPDRADVIVSGAAVVIAALELLRASSLSVDVNGVRLGAILAGAAGRW